MKRFETLGQMLVEQCEKHSSKTAMYLPGKAGYTQVTYQELGEQVFNYAKALKALNVQRGDSVCIISENCQAWMLFDWAAQTLGAVSVPIYPTLPADQAQYIVKDCCAKLVVVQNQKQGEKMAGLDGVRVVLLQADNDEHALVAHGIGQAMTRDEWKAEARAAKSEDLATLIYTSGTTGHPKGVMLPHRCWTSMCYSVPETLPVGESDLFFSFLPLSHVFARFGDHILPVSLGASVAFMGSVNTLLKDMQEVRPTIMLVVPRFLDNVRMRMSDKARKSGGLSLVMFEKFLEQGMTKQKGGFAPLYGLLNGIVGKKIRNSMGGRLRFFVSGGAALPVHTSEFFHALGIQVLQGYGLTETCAATCLNDPADNHPETVGKPFSSLEVKLAGDGEILIRGESVMDGYFNLQNDTAQVLDPDGWFHSGDIGEFVDGRLKITDRKKDLLVLANGKNVAPQPIENKLKESEFINEAVLFGDGLDYCVALIVPEFERIEDWLKTQGEGDKDAMTQKLLRQEIEKCNKTLADYEKVKKFETVAAAFSIDGGELTPSLKVRRKVVREKYAGQIESLIK